MRRGPGGSGTEPRCPPGSPRRPSTASGPGEGERGGGERGGGCPLTGPAERFPVGAVEAILRDVLWGHLREQPYEPGTCREMAKTIAEVPPCFVRSGGRGVLLLLQGGLGGGPTVRSRLYSSLVIKARVKALLVPRYKIVVVTHIGQLNEQSMQIGSRCLWDPATDTFSSYVFKNTSLFALANVYAIYFE